jgi:hypothetical protein
MAVLPRLQAFGATVYQYYGRPIADDEEERRSVEISIGRKQSCRKDMRAFILLQYKAVYAIQLHESIE